MKPSPIILIALAAFVALTGCRPTANARYHLQTEKTANGKITRVIDSESNTQLLYIGDLNGEPPSIAVLPMSPLDVSWVTVGAASQEEVTVWSSEEDGRNMHTITMGHEAPPLVLSSTDTDKDGDADVRIVGFPTDSGHIKYFDLDANGVLDAQSHTTLGFTENPGRTSRILVDQCWVAVGGDTDFQKAPLTAITLDTPPLTYQFREGIWRDE